MPDLPQTHVKQGTFLQLRMQGNCGLDDMEFNNKALKWTDLGFTASPRIYLTLWNLSLLFNFSNPCFPSLQNEKNIFH